jgi:hypothetical protein
VVGYLTGLVAARRKSLPIGIATGCAAGWILSSLAAIGQGDHYFEIVLPGMLVGAIAGLVTQRYTPSRGSLQAVAALALLLPTLCATVIGFQPSQPAVPDPLAPVSRLVGRWRGTSDGQPGSGSVERTYEHALGRFIRVRNRSEYPPQPKNIKGETHEDEGLFSYDRARSRLVLRQFHTEGFVNTYLADSGDSSRRLVFSSEAIENIPPGWRARETYVFVGNDQVEEVFELAEPGKDFEVYSRTRLERVK